MSLYNIPIEILFEERSIGQRIGRGIAGAALGGAMATAGSGNQMDFMLNKFIQQNKLDITNPEHKKLIDQKKNELRKRQNLRTGIMTVGGGAIGASS